MGDFLLFNVITIFLFLKFWTVDILFLRTCVPFCLFQVGDNKGFYSLCKLSLSSSRGRLMSSKLHQLVLSVYAVVAPSGELRGKGRCGVFAGKTV